MGFVVLGDGCVVESRPDGDALTSRERSTLRVSAQREHFDGPNVNTWVDP